MIWLILCLMFYWIGKARGRSEPHQPAGLREDLQAPGIDYVDRWIGFHLDSKGKLSADIWDWNPGSLAHVYKFRIPVPGQVQAHFLQHRECLLLDKFGRAKEFCEPESAAGPITGQPPPPPPREH